MIEREPSSWVNNELEVARMVAGRLRIKREDRKMGNKEKNVKAITYFLLALRLQF